MLTKRIVPCLDVKDGRVVKGTNFEGLRDAGDPVVLAERYAAEGADELVFLDISATEEKRSTQLQWVGDVARCVNIPFTVGGGIGSVQDVGRLLEAGADKVSINSAALKDPKLVDQLAHEFGSQCIVLAIDAKKVDDKWMVFSQGGKVATSRRLFTWASDGQSRGAGEILFTSIDHDGTQSGFVVDILSQLNTILSIPIIASGGAGRMEDFLNVFEHGRADAALASSVFHYGKISIAGLKEYLSNKGVPIRLNQNKNGK